MIHDRSAFEASEDVTHDVPVHPPTRSPRPPAREAAGRLARRARAATELSRAELAQVLDVPEETIAGWEEERLTPTPGERALLRLLLVSPQVCLALLPDR
ncbi:MAG: hypothetical protein M9894_15135 [Planctomycetes bacterium]|nr:hypothetical protein [Planctomycetota bacterium]